MKRSEKKTRPTRARDTRSGRTVSKAVAARRPATTVVESIDTGWVARMRDARLFACVDSDGLHFTGVTSIALRFARKNDATLFIAYAVRLGVVKRTDLMPFPTSSL